MSWKKEPALTSAVHNGCACCPDKPVSLEINRILAVGFGGVTVSKGDQTLWSGDDPGKSIEEFEKLAKLDPEHDWRVHFLAPLWEGTWQRHGEGEWNLIAKGEGFA